MSRLVFSRESSILLIAKFHGERQTLRWLCVALPKILTDWL
jgi:hypothetical protein